MGVKHIDPSIDGMDAAIVTGMSRTAVKMCILYWEKAECSQVECSSTHVRARLERACGNNWAGSEEAAVNCASGEGLCRSCTQKKWAVFVKDLADCGVALDAYEAQFDEEEEKKAESACLVPGVTYTKDNLPQ
ncbi:hypothetical protein PRZ48_005155 [Zasmidium cellare]|uniref:Uncharacterized protein n=1 Tax=Zasmidium cellare TaxID=395010 RepID=A0ABR0ES74_ZASCE|nr:hypothetical protein PRZ48_005155 [Zasmidium cellare]